MEERPANKLIKPRPHVSCGLGRLAGEDPECLLRRGQVETLEDLAYAVAVGAD